MSDTFEPGAEAGAADNGGDEFEREYEAARESQSGDPEDSEEAAGQDDATVAQESPQQREPLAPEEVQRRWKDTQTALRREREETRALKARLAEIEQGGARDRQQQEGPPDPTVDPIAALEWLQDRVAQNDQREAEQAQREEQQTRAQQEFRTLVSDFQAAEADFREATPDYDAAVAHLRNARVQEFKMLGFSEREALQQFNAEVIDTLQEVRGRGLDPAQFAYGLAKLRGYQPQTGGQGADKLNTIARGQGASRTLSGAGGGKGGGELTVESVSNLKGAAFDTAFAKLMQQERERERRLS